MASMAFFCVVLAEAPRTPPTTPDRHAPTKKRAAKRARLCSGAAPKSFFCSVFLSPPAHQDGGTPGRAGGRISRIKEIHAGIYETPHGT